MLDGGLEVGGLSVAWVQAEQVLQRPAEDGERKDGSAQRAMADTDLYNMVALSRMLIVKRNDL